MSDTVWIVLIIAVVVLVVLVLFREQLSRFFIKADPEGIEMEMQTREQQAATGERAGVNIVGNRQVGRGNQIDIAQRDVNVERNTQLGRDQEIIVRPDQPAGEQPPGDQP